MVTERDDYWYDGETRQFYKYHFGGQSGVEEAAETVHSQSGEELDYGIGTGEQPPLRMAQPDAVEVVPGEDSPEPAFVEQTRENEMHAASARDLDAGEGDAAMEQPEGENAVTLPRTEGAPANGQDALAELFDEVFGDGKRARITEAAAGQTTPGLEITGDADARSPGPPSEVPVERFGAPAERLAVMNESAAAAEPAVPEHAELERQTLLPCDLIVDQVGTVLQNLRQRLSAIAAEAVSEVPAVAGDQRAE